MTQDKIRAAFDEWFNPLKMSTMVHETAVSVFAESAYRKGHQACAAEMGKDMEKMREALDNCRKDYDVALNNSYAAEAIMGDSYPERMQNDINRNFVKMQLERITETIALADKWRG